MLASVMTASMKQLNGKADKTKSAVFAMLKVTRRGAGVRVRGYGG